tara:strand:+ start:2204 stop:2443 length:240 start_codon:yes stop_codon:yes gene_type:complete
MNGTSAPSLFDISAIFSESVVTISLDMELHFNAASIVYAIKGLPQSSRIFLSFIRFEPSRAGIRPRILIFSLSYPFKKT